jgi:hypothetical protein
MQTISITPEHYEFVAQYAPKQDIGGFSNLSAHDLNKATRHDYQITGVLGELSWYLFRYGNYNKLQALLDQKHQELRPLHKGDGGLDDIITYNGYTRKIDIKSSHVTDIDKISHLNLVIPEREFHTNMIYVCAFTVGPNRTQVEEVVLAGWCVNEDVHKRWRYDPHKYCVPVPELRKLEVLQKIL